MTGFPPFADIVLLAVFVTAAAFSIEMFKMHLRQNRWRAARKRGADDSQ